MAQVLIRAVAVFRRIPVALTWLLLAGGGAALVLLPLFGLPGYELSAALALGHGLLGAVAGISAARLERRMIQSIDPRPRGAVRFDSALRSTLAAAGAACVVNLSALVPPLAASVIYALASTRCDPFSHVGFFPLLTMPSAILAGTVGVFVGFATRRAWTASLLYLATLLCSLAVTLPPILFGPQVFAFNHLLGYVPGPLYDEALSITGALGWFRLETLLLALTVVVWPALMLDMVSGSLTRPHLRPGSALLLAGLIAAIFTLEERGPQLGTRMNEATLEEKLGGKKESDHFVLHYPRGKPKDELDRLVRDLEFRHAQISAFLGGPPPGEGPRLVVPLGGGEAGAGRGRRHPVRQAVAARGPRPRGPLPPPGAEARAGARDGGAVRLAAVRSDRDRRRPGPQRRDHRRGGGGGRRSGR